MPFNTELHHLKSLERLQRLERLEKLRRLQKLEGLEFSYLSYELYEYKEGGVVYCDIPYRNTYCTQYKDTEFDHDTFWNWAKTRPFDVFVSERTIPDDVEIIFTRNVPNRANFRGIDGFKTEYLVRV